MNWIDLSDWIHGETGGYLRYSTENRNWFETDFPKFLDEAAKPLADHERTDEHASHIIEALETGRTYRGHFNVRNNGIITNLPDDCIIESPGFVDRFGINMVEGVTLPAGLRRHLLGLRPRAAHGASRPPMTGDVDLLKHAVLHDPLVGAICTPDEVWQMVDEMVVAQAQWLPQYADAIPAAAERRLPTPRSRPATGKGAARQSSARSRSSAPPGRQGRRRREPRHRRRRLTPAAAGTGPPSGRPRRLAEAPRPRHPAAPARARRTARRWPRNRRPLATLAETRTRLRARLTGFHPGMKPYRAGAGAPSTDGEKKRLSAAPAPLPLEGGRKGGRPPSADRAGASRLPEDGAPTPNAARRPQAPAWLATAAPKAVKSGRDTGSFAAFHSGCHCTAIAKPGAASTTIASGVSSEAWPSMTIRLPLSRMPCPCSEFTITSGAPRMRSNRPPAARRTACRCPYFSSSVPSGGIRWFIRPGISRISRMQRAAEGDVELLEAAADAEDRHPLRHAFPDQRQRHRVTLGIEAPVLLGRLVAVQARMDVRRPPVSRKPSQAAIESAADPIRASAGTSSGSAPESAMTASMFEIPTDWTGYWSLTRWAFPMMPMTGLAICPDVARAALQPKRR